MFTQLRVLLATMLLTPAMAMAGDIDTGDVRDFLNTGTGHADMMDEINRDIEARPTAAGSNETESRRAKAVPGTLDTHYNPNLLFVPQTYQGDL